MLESAIYPGAGYALEHDMSQSTTVTRGLYAPEPFCTRAVMRRWSRNAVPALVYFGAEVC